MIGVTNPGGARRPRKEVLTAVVSLSLGYMISTAFVILVLAAGAEMLTIFHEKIPKSTVAVAVLLLFGLLDLANMTPMSQRQVPQSFVRSLTAGPRNLLWGADLGLLVTSQKTTSLIWIGLSLAVVDGQDRPLVALAPLVSALGFLIPFAWAAVSRPELQVAQKLATFGLSGRTEVAVRRVSGSIALLAAAIFAGGAF